MICPNCHESIPANSKFCPNCGQAQQVQPETRERRHQNVPTTSEGNVFFAYAKNNFLLLLIAIVITVGLFFWKAVLGVIALVLVLTIYYLRATATHGAKEGTSKKLQEKLAQSRNKQSQVQQVQSATTYQQPQPARRQFNSIGNVIVLIASALVTLVADFFGNFIQINAQNTGFDASTPMSLYEALNLGGVAAKIANAMNIQVGIQGILLVAFYIIVAIPVLVIILTFAGGRFSRFVLSLVACATYAGTLGYLFYETKQLQNVGITLGLTPGIMFYVAIISSFVMLVYSTRVKK